MFNPEFLATENNEGPESNALIQYLQDQQDVETCNMVFSNLEWCILVMRNFGKQNLQNWESKRK